MQRRERGKQKAKRLMLDTEERLFNVLLPCLATVFEGKKKEATGLTA